MPLSVVSDDPQVSLAVCRHCGTPFRVTKSDAEFCCAGCRFVSELIRSSKLDRYYDLKEGDLQPVKSLVFQKRDYSWLEAMVREAESDGSPCAGLALDLQGVSCLGCVWLIEKVFSRKPGALNIRVDPGLGRIEMKWKPHVLNVVEFARELQSFGYLVGPASAAGKPDDRGLVVRLGICAALALNTMLFTLPGYLGMERSFVFAPLFGRLALLFGTMSFLIGGSYFFRRSWKSLQQGILHIDLPISLGLIAAYISSFYAWAQGASSFVYLDFVSVFTFLMLGGRWLQQRMTTKNRRFLLDAGVATRVCEEGSDRSLPLEAIQPGTRFEVPPGQSVPVRSCLLSEAASLGLEWINGESEAIVSRCGQIVASGSINYGTRPVVLRALETWPESLLARLTAATHVAPYRNLPLERFIQAYLWIVLGIGATAFVAWWWRTGDCLLALQVLTSILVVSCPCASGIALPLANDLATSFLRRAGVFIREASLWPRLKRVRKIVFDKTGTLTMETMSLQNPEALERLSLEEMSVLLAMIQDNLHPVSCALREELLARSVKPAVAGASAETVGLGLKLFIANDVWMLGRNGWAGQGTGDCVFSRNGRVLASFSFGEKARTDARAEIAALQARHYEVFILSGDRRGKVEAMTAALGLPKEMCRAEMSPSDKAESIRALNEHDTLVIGDGANDSLAFDAALCSGTPAIDRGLLERKADFYYLGRGLAGVRLLMEVARRLRATTRRVIGFTIVYNAVAIGIAIVGQMSPLVASVLMPASSLVSVAIVSVMLRSRQMTQFTARVL